VLTVSGGGIPSWAAAASSGVTSFSAGSTGLTPSSTTTGAVTLSGTLNVANGGTGSSSASGARSNLNVPANDGTGASGTWGISISGNAGTVTNGVYTTNFTGTNQSLTGTGYQKLPGGLIIQWGFVPVTSGLLTVNFPIAFPSSCCGLTLSRLKPGSSGGTNISSAIASVPTTTTFTASVDNNASDLLTWIALGF
jgi:hypothetical protein